MSESHSEHQQGPAAFSPRCALSTAACSPRTGSDIQRVWKMFEKTSYRRTGVDLNSVFVLFFVLFLVVLVLLGVVLVQVKVAQRATATGTKKTTPRSTKRNFLGSRRSLAGVKISGRSVGRISTWWRPPKLPWSRVMTKKTPNFTTIYTTTISISM